MKKIIAFLLTPFKKAPKKSQKLPVPPVLETIANIEFLRSTDVEATKGGYDHEDFKKTFTGYVDPNLDLSNYAKGGVETSQSTMQSFLGGFSYKLKNAGEKMADESSDKRQIAICKLKVEISIEDLLGENFEKFAFTNKNQLIDVFSRHRTEFLREAKGNVFPYFNKKTHKRFVIVIYEDPGSFETLGDIQLPSWGLQVFGKCINNNRPVGLTAQLFLGL